MGESHSKGPSNLVHRLDDFDFHDLSVPMIHGAVGWPTLPTLAINKRQFVERDLVESYDITISSQNYTHFDTPSHLIQGGKAIDKYDVRTFVLDAVALDVSDRNNLEIRKADLSEYVDQISSHRALVLRTGFEKGYFDVRYDYGYLGLDGSRFLSSFDSLKMVGTDGLGIGGWSGSVPARFPARPADEVREVHKHFMSKDILIIENLTGTRKLFEARQKCVEGIFIALPLNFIGIDGGPCRAVFLKPRVRASQSDR